MPGSRRVTRAGAEALWLTALLFCALSRPAFAEPRIVDRQLTEAAARKACPASFDNEEGTEIVACPAESFGVVGTVEGQTFLYGTYRLIAAGGNELLGNSLVLYRRRPGTRLLEALSAFRAVTFDYDRPQLFSSAGRLILRVPGQSSGTASENGEHLFVWRNGRWMVLDTRSWLADLERRLPERYYVSWGVYPDYRNMSVTTPLWKDGDGNSAPTGGRADISFVWRGDRLAIGSLRARFGLKYAASAVEKL